MFVVGDDGRGTPRPYIRQLFELYKRVFSMMSKRKIEDYLDLPYHFIITRDEDGGFDIAIGELPGCVTYAQAWEDIPLVIREAMSSWIGSALKHGDAVPEPSAIMP